MSAQTIRLAIQSYLAGLGITGISKVYRAQPWDPIADEGWLFADGLDYDAVVIVHIERQQESRASLPARTVGRTEVGNKAVDYSIGLIVLYQYLIPDELPITADTDVWVDSLDAILDALRDGIQADPTLGCADHGPVFQAGQEANDLTIDRDLPRRLPDKVLSWQLLRLTVTEIINA